MKRLAIILFTLGWLSIAPFARAATIRAATGGLSVMHSLLWAPYELKLLKKYGADLEYIAIERGTIGMQTLVANQSQFLFSTGSLAVNANLVSADITIVGGGLNFIPDKLIAQISRRRKTFAAKNLRSAASAHRPK